MREIKFRGYDFTKKIMIPFEKIRPLDYVYDSELDSMFYAMENHLHIMQYTGLKDKNGKEIYEGDIVKYKYTSREQIAEIKYNKEKLGFDFADNKVNLSYAYNFRQINNIEVIGNIYQNPELLEN